MGPEQIRVAFLVGSSSSAAVPYIERVSRLPGINPVGILVDTHQAGWKARLKNLRRNVRREGAGYVLHRAASAFRSRVEAMAEGVVSPDEVDALLRRAFPDRCFSLAELGARDGIPLHEVGSLNSAKAAATLSALNADLGIVLGTRILKRSTFGVPKLGCINVHKGKVPEFRGMPPGFWEIFEGASNAGVTVHFVDDGLDTGNIVAASEIPISPRESPRSLHHKLDLLAVETLAVAVEKIVNGEITGTPQPASEGKTRTRPTRAQQVLVARKLDVRRENDWVEALKLLLYLGIYHSGFYRAFRWMRARMGVRASIVLYHRVNDYGEDALTVSLKRLAQHMLIVQRFYRAARTESIVRMLEGGADCGPGSVAIHFDDCYRDVYTQGGPLLRAAGIPACFFISTGFLDTDRVFEHDRTRYAHSFPNLTSEELADWLRQGFEVGAHTVNHVNLGVVEGSERQFEIVECGRRLQEITGHPVEFFSFPFGRPEHISSESKTLIRQQGYKALFSAHGGFVSRNTDLFDIPRFGVSGQHAPVRFLMDLEGLTLEDLRRSLRGLMGGRANRA